MQDKPSWNAKKTISSRILAQLKGMTEDEQRTFLVKLLDYIDPTLLVALEFAYSITPEPEPTGKEVSTEQ